MSREIPFRHRLALVGAVALSLTLAACGASSATKTAPKVRPHGEVVVLYAGSLVDVMENSLGPAFHAATGYTMQGISAGSTALAQQIKGRLRQGDVFISASPSVNALLEGKANGDWVSWYASFAQAPLVIGYSPKSSFANALRTRPWYSVMEEKGFRLGRTDPKLDPKGSLTVSAVEAAQTFYHQPGLAQRVLGSAENPAQVFPEQDLVGRLQTGQLDAGFFYSNEAVQANIPTIALPSGLHFAADFTVTVLRGAPHAAAANAFVRFLLGSKGLSLLRADGLKIVPFQLSGSPNAVPKVLRGTLGR